VIFRVFNDTIALRYEWPEPAALKDFDIMDELTEFVFPADHPALWEPV
jgi:alpha-glucosidase